MPFYFRIPLPGPFGYSARIGGHKRRRHGPTAAQRKATQHEADVRRWAKEKTERERIDNLPENIAARAAAKADLESRTRRGKITACTIDPLKGGSFTLTDIKDDNINVTIEPSAAQDFLSLKKGDIVELVLSKDNTGFEQFWHLSRANGSTPRVRAGENTTLRNSHR